MCDNPEPELPCVWTLLGATMALMTAHAAPVADARVDAATQRRLMSRKIVSNLFFLQHHPLAPEDLRRVLGNLHGRWLAGMAATAGPTGLHGGAPAKPLDMATSAQAGAAEPALQLH